MAYNLNAILDRLDYWLAYERKWQETFTALHEVVSPSSYPPIVECNFAEAFIDGVALAIPTLKEELEYYAYEMPKNGAATIIYDEKTYNAKNRKEFVEYLGELLARDL